MPRRLLAIVLLLLLGPLAGPAIAAAEIESLPADKEPLLRVDPGGPAAFVTALAFGPDGKTLYAAGWDKVIRVWTKNAKGFFEAPRSSFRVPVGPGLGGSLNALALSADGDWLAAGGNGVARQIAGFRDLGFLVPSFGVRDPLMLRDMGTIYLFNTRDRSVRILRGHRGYVTALTFGPRRGKAIPLLLSVAVEEKEGNAVETQLTARLWDADRGESVAVLSGLPSKAIDSRRPGAALWGAGERGNEVRAAFALYDGKLRLWDPAQPTEQPRQLADLPANLSLSYLDRGNRLLTTGYDKTQQQAQLSVWHIPARGGALREQRIGAGEGLARGLTLLSRKGDGTADVAAVLRWIPGRPQVYHQYNLSLIDLAGAEPKIVKKLSLWEDPAARQPVVAASLHGEHLAVAGSSDQTIRVYSLRALLGDEKPAPQILRGDAVLFRHASFVRRGKDLGLLLNRKTRKTMGDPAPQPDKSKGDWVFDFGKRRLSDNLADWETAGPQASRWKTAFDKATFTIFDGRKKISVVTVRKGELVTDYALVPPGGAVKLPLLAVASHQGGQPRLTVYNAQSGEPLREFTGHTERLESLDFAPDGRLLVSASQDGTVCVWSLTDLDTIWKKHGGLPGVTVGSAEKGAKAVKILEVEEDSPVHGKLKRGDVLAGLVVEKKLQRIASPRAFYEALYQLRPGTEISLRRGDPDGGDDVSFVVGQGIDERKPLFSLFVIGAARVADCEWIGWSPIGPYEASSATAEKYLGWHFNTGDPKAPTRFADAGQYRDLYYRKNLLDLLIQRGALGQVELPRLPPPVLGVWVEDAGRFLPQVEHETLLVRRPRIQLRVALLNNRPLSSLSALTWRLDDGAETPFALDQPGEGSFALPLTLARGEHRIVVTARTREAAPQPTTKSLNLRYQPPPPAVVFQDAGRQIFVRQADYTLDAKIKPRVGGENVRVTIHHRHNEGQEKPQSRTLMAQDIPADGLALNHRLKLRPGNNEVEVIAVNAGAPDGGRKPETEPMKFWVFYHFKARPPVIAFQKVVPLSRLPNAGGAIVVSSRPVVVRVPIVDLFGHIKSAEEPLTEAVWDRGKATLAARLERFEPRKQAAFAFEQRITLEPGRQIIRLRARSKNSEEVEHHILLEYQPPLPLVSRIRAPREGEILEGSAETKMVAVRGEVRIPPEVRAYKAVLFVNGKPAVQRLEIDEKAGTLAGQAVLGPGENRLWIEMSNEWGASGSSEVIAVRYVRPPIIVGQPGHEAVPNRALLNLTAQVLSATPLQRASVRVEVNGKESAANEVRIEAGAKNLWSVRLLGVPLDAGSPEQKIVLHLGNTEALCRSPAVLTLRSDKVLPAPEAEFLDPRRDAVVSDARVAIRFQVRSQTRLERVRLLWEGHPPFPINLAGARRVGDTYELSATTEVELTSGPNRLSVEAVSVSGRLPNSPQLVLNYVPPPLRLVMESLTELRPDGTAIRPQLRQQGSLVFPEVEAGRVWLHGHVSWTDKGANWRDDVFLLRVFVNGFQQMPYQVLRKPNESKTPFQVQLLLNRRSGNRISLLAFRQDAGSPVEARVDCVKPIAAQRLHILALAPHSQPDEVKERLLKAIRAPREENREGRESAFQEVQVLPPLTGSHVAADFLCGRLGRFKEELRIAQNSAGRDRTLMNEVLLLYYEGGEKIDDRGHFFETYSPSGANRFGMPCDKMVSYLVDVPGAHVLLLDVDQSGLERKDARRDKIARWKDDFPDVQAHVVVMRCARRVEAGRRSQVRLIPVLQKQLPQAARLSKLIPLIEEALASSNDHDLLVFTKYLPAELADLIIGALP